MIEPITENSSASSLVARQLALTASFARLAGITASAPSASSTAGAATQSAPFASASPLLNMDNKARALAVTFYAARLIQSDNVSHLGLLASNHINLLA